jgi:hypothetical protein
MKKIFGNINLTWPKLILFAVIAGVYTAAMALLPIAKNTSFADLVESFEVWILFGILIILNSKSPLDSALKCFVFFLISQPLVYLIQVPFTALGWQIFTYYRPWFIWTLLTLPMGYVGYYLKQGKWWGLLILAPILLLLGEHIYRYMGRMMFDFPHHLLTVLFCIGTMILYPFVIFEDKKIRTIGCAISAVIAAGAMIFALMNRNVYTTDVLTNNGSAGAVFDDTYSVYLEDESLGTVSIIYNEAIEDYMVRAQFVKSGTTNLVLTDANGKKTVFHLIVEPDTYDIEMVSE